MTGLVGVIAALSSTIFWAIGAITFKRLGKKLEPLGMTMLKSLCSVLLLILLAFILKENLMINFNFLLPLALSGILGIAIGDSLFFASLNRLSPIILSILLLAGPDIATGILAFFMLKENPPLLVWIGIILTITGLACLLFPVNKLGNNVKTSVAGLVFALLSLICTSLSMVIIKPVLSQVTTLTATIYRMFFGGILLLIFGIFSKKLNNWAQPFKSNQFRASFFLIVSLIAVGGFWLSTVAIKNIDLVTASTLMSLEPFFIILFMVLLQKYVPSKKEIIGMCYALIGIFLISLGEV